MGKKLIIIMAAFLLCGCASMRYNKTKISHESVDSSYHKILTYTNEFENWKTSVDSIHKIKTFVFDIYDTDKTPDSCGNYPLMVHGEYTENTQHVNTSTETCVDSTMVCDTIQIHNKTEKYDYTQKNTKYENGVVNLVCLFVIFIAIGYAYKVYKNLKF